LPMITLLEDLEPEVTKQALHSLTLLSWCFYSEHENVPSFDYVTKLGYRMLRFTDNEELTDQERLWQSILRDYDFQNTDEFDLEIAKAVETGYITENAFSSQAQKLNEQVKMSKSQQSFREAWDAFHDSFADNQEELLDGLFESVKKNSKYISPAELDATVTLFRELGDGLKADELVMLYCEERKEEKGLFDLDRYPFARDIRDQRLVQEFSKLKITQAKRRTIKEVLEKIAGKDSWGGEDVEILSTASPDDFYTLFKTEKGNHLSSWINTCLMFGRFANASEKDKKIATSATEALKRLAQESPLNARRVAKFGVVRTQ
jgi:hypothetical protein